MKKKYPFTIVMHPKTENGEVEIKRIEVSEESEHLARRKIIEQALERGIWIKQLDVEKVT